MTEEDQKYLKMCIDLAKHGAGSVSPNPLVGAIIVKNNKIIAQEYHSKIGEAHAEAKAIANADKDDLIGSTIYCNLEPCCHTNKKTPPCVPKIIESGIKKVVISNVDPNPYVAGQGIEQLRESGIEVISGGLDDKGKELNKIFFKYIQTGLPFITIKIAQSIDSKISASEGIQTWLTCEESKKFVHEQRAIYDAVLIGANTVKVDNPHLTVRLVEGRNPRRIIIDGSLSSPTESRVYSDDNRESTIVFTKTNSNSEKISLLKEKGVKVFELEPNTDGKLKLLEILKILGNEQISSLFVEGGAAMFSKFVESNLFDEIIILKAPILLGTGVDSQVKVEELNLDLVSTEMLGEDTKYVYKNLDGFLSNN